MTTIADSNKQQHSSGNKFSRQQLAVSCNEPQRSDQFIVVTDRNVSDSPQVWCNCCNKARCDVNANATTAD